MANLVYEEGYGYKLNVDGVGPKLSIAQRDILSVAVVVTGASSLVGTMRIRESNTESAALDPGEIVSFDNGTSSVDGYDVTANGRVSFEMSNTGAGWAQLDWDSTSGDGYCEFYAVTKRS